jgi:hypothetical protein
MCEIDSEVVVNLMSMPWLDLRIVTTKLKLLRSIRGQEWYQ